MSHYEELNTFIEDIKKVIKAETYLNEISTTRLKSPLEELLEYGFNNIVKSSYDLLKVCHEIPSLENKLTSLYDKKIYETIKKDFDEDNIEKYQKELQKIMKDTIKNVKFIKDEYSPN